MEISQSIDPLDLIDFIDRKNKVYQKNLLDKVEIAMKNQTEYKQVRHLILDSQNNFARMLIKVILGKDYEGVVE